MQLETHLATLQECADAARLMRNQHALLGNLHHKLGQMQVGHSACAVLCYAVDRQTRPVTFAGYHSVAGWMCATERLGSGRPGIV